MAAKLKAIQPNNLQQQQQQQRWYENNKCQVSMKGSEEQKEARRKDGLWRLLTSPAAAAELQGFVLLAFECLAADRVYPVPAEQLRENVCEGGDLLRGQKAVDRIVLGANKFYKRLLVLVALAMSPKFVRQFCPGPSDTRTMRCLVNPQLMQEFVGGPGQRGTAPLHRWTARMLCGTDKLSEYAGTCLRIWRSYLSQRPDREAEIWSKIDNNAVSVELRRIQQVADSDRPDDPDNAYRLIEYNPEVAQAVAEGRFLEGGL